MKWNYREKVLSQSLSCDLVMCDTRRLVIARLPTTSSPPIAFSDLDLACEPSPQYLIRNFGGPHSKFDVLHVHVDDRCTGTSDGNPTLHSSNIAYSCLPSLTRRYPVYRDHMVRLSILQPYYVNARLQMHFVAPIISFRRLCYCM